jgi:hypothetical protein
VHPPVSNFTYPSPQLPPFPFTLPLAVPILFGSRLTLGHEFSETRVAAQCASRSGAAVRRYVIKISKNKNEETQTYYDDVQARPAPPPPPLPVLIGHVSSLLPY